MLLRGVECVCGGSVVGDVVCVVINIRGVFPTLFHLAWSSLLLGSFSKFLILSSR